MPAAIIGLYNSGSSLISQIVEKLGADIGRPLWDQHFESAKLKNKLSEWWNAPSLQESSNQSERIAYLKLWAAYHEESSRVVCAKHPLLCLSAPDLDKAWGSEYKAIRASRPLQKSIERLAARNWFSEPDRMQRVLHAASEDYFSRKTHFCVEYEELLLNPVAKTQQIAEFLDLNCSDEKIRKAASVVKSPIY
tara:strand:- start:103 stop:681 length:579 start_codon:yes stop_codon:yes gene_type:complete